jgi:hypothetical protein
MKRKFWWISTAMIALISWWHTPSVWAGPDERRLPVVEGRRSYRGSYINPIFGYSVSIPDDLIGLGAVPPAPNHGIEITLDDSPGSHIEIDAEYNALDSTSPTQQADMALEGLKQLGASKIRIKREITTLCNLSALRQTLRYEEVAETPAVEEAVFALLSLPKRSGESYRAGIAYEVTLWTTAESREKAESVFLQVLRSFKCTAPKG